jgi:outer membrane protein OmpA-like peptidoglycan-associated protein
VVKLDAFVNFVGDSTKFLGTASSTISKLASTIKANKPKTVLIVVEGWVNKTGDTSKDSQLALARAKAAAKALEAQGIKATVSVLSMGIHPTTGASARRADLKVTLTK